jgi:NADPH2:quinone reductase
MKAIRIHEFGEPDVLRLEDVPDPTPAHNQVVVRAKAIGVNPVDTYIRAGKYGPKPFPFTPGADAAGVVESVGTGVAGCRVGDRVYLYGAITGSYAEKILCDEKSVHPLPPHVSFQQGAAMGVPYGTAYRALVIRGAAKPGETVLIHGGSGGVGTAAIQIAHALGLTVFATAGSDRGMELIRQQGAHQAFNHRKDGYQQEILAATDGRGVPLILEMLANVNLAHDLLLLGKHGRVVVIGNRGTIEINPRETMTRDADIRGMTLANATEWELQSIHAALVAGLENKSLVPVIGKELPLADAPAAHKLVLEPGAYGKIVLIP